MTRYFFAPETGNDSNSGLTTALPKKTTSAAGALVLAGNQISWRCGEKVTFGAGSAGWSLSLKQLASNCTIDYYDDIAFEQKPLFDGMTYLVAGVDDANWTSLGDGRWTRAFNAEVNRMFAGTTEANIRAGTIGTPFGYVSAAASVTAEMKWHMLTASPFTVTVYTGGTTAAFNPPTFYDGLAVVGNGIATAESIKISRCSKIIFDHIQIWGGQRRGFAALAESAATCEDLGFLDCEVHATGRSGSGFSIVNNAVSGSYIDGVTMVRPYANAHSTSSENDSDTSRWSSQNGIAILGEVQNVLIIDPIIEGGYRHSAYQAQCDGTTTKYICRDIHVVGTGVGYFDGADSDYCHLSDTDAEGYVIEGLEYRNQITRSQFAGTGKVSTCKWLNPRASSAHRANTAQCIWSQNWNDVGDYRKVADVTFENCLIVNPPETPIAILEDRDGAADDPEAGFETNAIKISYCTIVDLDNPLGRTTCVDHQVQGTPFVNSGLIMTNNTFVTAIADPLRRETAAGVQTTYDVNEYSGASDNAKYASAADAGLDDTTFERLPVRVANQLWLRNRAVKSGRR